MAFEIPKIKYSGKIKEITLGTGDKAVTVGGETSYPFYLFEGEMPNVPRIAMEVWDCPPQDWAEAALEPFSGVTDDPVAWAKKCVDDYGAEMICLQLISTDPNGMNRDPDEAADIVKKVADANKYQKLTVAKGEAEAIQTVFGAIHTGRPTNDLIAIKYLEALQKIADGKSTKVFLPYEATGIMGSIAGIGELLKEKISPAKEKKEPTAGTENSAGGGKSSMPSV